MAGVEVEKIVPNTEEKTTTTEPTTETPKETVQTDDSVVEVEIKGEEEPNVQKETEKTEISPVKEEKPVEIPTVVEEEKTVKPAAEAPALDGKAV